MVKIFLYIWQLPQNLLGIVLKLIMRAEKQTRFGVDVYIADPVFLLKYRISNFCMGKYIIVQDLPIYGYPLAEITVKHERGHQIQSQILGPLYLLAVGLPSLMNNLRARTNQHIYQNYYNLYPEKWADRLGKVTRN